MKIRTNLPLYIMTITILAVLAGCIPILSTDMSLNMGLQEQWTFDVVIVPESGFESQVIVDELNSQFANNEDVKNLEVKITVEAQNPLPDGNIPVKMSMQGKGYDTLNQVFSENVITVDNSSGQRLLRFSMAGNQGLMVQFTTFTLSGGKILEHNGALLDERTVVWRNYTGDMQATMVEPTYMDYWLYIAIAGIVCMIVAFFVLVIIGFTRSSKPKKANTRQVPRSKTCTQCGSAIPAIAIFCPNCGAQQN